MRVLSQPAGIDTRGRVALRTGEISIRVSLGASPPAMLREVLGETLLNVGVEVTLGMVAAVGAARVLQALLFDVQPADPITLGGVVVLVASVAVLATLAPALRAMRVDPVQALRQT
jgi:ABC-type antimicrobial peptide transport system permease subunit